MIEFRVDDMTCAHCVSTVTRAIKDIEPSAQVDIDLEQHRVRIAGAADRSRYEAAIRDAGYTPDALPA